MAGGSAVAAHRLSCLLAFEVLVPRPGIKPTSPCIGRWILNHWTTREVYRMLLKQYIQKVLTVSGLRRGQKEVREKALQMSRGKCSRKKGNNTCKDSEVGTYLLCSRANKKVRPMMLGQK